MTGPHKVVHLVVASTATRAGTPATSEGALRGDARALLEGLREGERAAARQFVEEQRAHVERVLTRILGWHSELDDLTQDVFARAFARVAEVREAEALRGWLSAIAVFVAREAIRRKRRHRWLLFRPSQDTPDIPCAPASLEARAALRAFYEVVGEMDVDARIAFTLRWVDGMELTEVAKLATFPWLP